MKSKSFYGIELNNKAHPLNKHLVAKIILSSELKRSIIQDNRYNSEFLLP
jgi:hypothetical protein